MRDGILDGLGNPIPARARQAMVDAREPLLTEVTACCTHPSGCRYEEVPGTGLCIGHLEGPGEEDPPA